MIRCFCRKIEIIRFFIADQIIIYGATPPNEPNQCILTHFNNCKVSKAQMVCFLMMVFFTPKRIGALLFP